jgi:hypothetical protein
MTVEDLIVSVADKVWNNYEFPNWKTSRGDQAHPGQRAGT